MPRVLAGWFFMAAAFAAMVYWLELGAGSLRATGFTFAGVLLIGYPVLYLCCKRGWWTPFHTVGLGLVAGFLVALVFDDGKVLMQFLLLIFLVAGALFGLGFWIMAIWRNEDLTCPKSFCLPCGTVYRVARNAIRRRV